jgi:hypothetical protein
VYAALLELDPGSGHQIAHGARHQHLVRPGFVNNPRSGMNGNAGEVPSRHLAFAGMESRSDRQPKRVDTFGDRHRTPDCSGRSVKGGEKAVAGVNNLSTPMT